MSEVLANGIGPIDLQHVPLLLIMGVALFLGTIGARFFQRLRVPQVVGTIVIGMLIGRSGLGWIDAETVHSLEGFHLLALGLIGFMVGGELRGPIFRRHGRQFVTILLAEGLVTCLIVTVGVLVLARWGWHWPFPRAMALALVLGAIATATAPAATVDVLWECRSQGPLTQTVFAIVALDDGLALLIFGFAASLATSLMGHHATLLQGVLWPCYEIFGSVLVGLATGGLLIVLLKGLGEPDKILAVALAAVMWTIGLSMALRLDAILAAMALGTTLANGLPRRSRSTFELVERFAPPIYVLFFVLVGAGMEMQRLTGPVVMVALVYLAGRTAGKFLGTWLGARWSGAPAVVRRYGGMCLFSQAGVAVGLSIVVGHRFADSVGPMIVLVITATTFAVQLIGPPCVKLAVKWAGEAGRRVTREDLLRRFTAADVMDAHPDVLLDSVPLKDVMAVFSRSDALTFPVVDRAGVLQGAVTIESIREGLQHQDHLPWLLACDLMQPVPEAVTPGTSLEEVLRRMDSCRQETLCVIDPESKRLEGLLDRRRIQRTLDRELLRGREEITPFQTGEGLDR